MPRVRDSLARMSMRWILAVLLFVAACDPIPTVPLSALSGKKVFFRWYPATADPEVMEVVVTLGYQDSECVAVDATATLDGERLKVVSRGELGAEAHGNRECESPAWSTTMPAGGDPASTITIEIKDETAAITYELTHPFAERTIRASTGGSMSAFPGNCDNAPLTGDLVLPPGQAVTLSWSPATDTIEGLVVLRGWSAASQLVFFLSTPDLTVTGSTISFVAPASSGQAARASLHGDFVPATRRCEGADACSMRSPYCSNTIVRLP